MSRRLLLAGAGGSAGGISVVPKAVFDITTSGYGAWAIPMPAAYYVASTDRTILGGVKQSDGSMWVAHRDHGSATTSTPFNLGASFADDGPTDVHNDVSTIARASDDTLVTAYCSHEDNRVRVRLSSSPGDASAWASEQTLDPGYGGVYTYPMLVQLRGLTNQPIYLFARSTVSTPQVGRLVYTVSTDGGASWSAWSLLFTGSISPAKSPYWTIGSDFDTRFDVFVTPSGTATDVYHFWFDGATAKTYKSDGTEITASRPFQTGSMTQVYDGTGSGGTFALGAAWDAATGTSVLMYVRLISSGTDNDIWTARWRSGAWSRQQVVATVGGRHSGNAFLPSANIAAFDPNYALVHKKVSSRYEAFLEVSADDGATWTETQLTTSSTHDQMWVMPVFFTRGKADFVWLDISYSNDISWTVSTIRGYGRD